MMLARRMLERIARFYFCGCSLVLLLASALMASPAVADNCYHATAQGSTGPADWETYCWLDFTSYNHTTASSGSGQNFSYTLPDGTVMTFNLRARENADARSATTPSWSGAAIGNTAFTGIAGRPVLYQTQGGTTRLIIRNIQLTPPTAGTITNYMFVAADGESSNGGESLRFQTNGGDWALLGQAGPISGSTYPAINGVGTTNVEITGRSGRVGAHILGSRAPGRVVATLVGSGLQGVMFAVRFASIRLNTEITGSRAAPSDQFRFSINSTSSGAVLAEGTSSGTGQGPFTAATLTSTAALALTLNQSMASGSNSAISDYNTVLTCTNDASTSTPLPNNVETTNYDFGALQYGDAVRCTFYQSRPAELSILKRSDIVSDPISGTTNPKAIPGAVMQYTLRLHNSGDGLTDTDTVTLRDPLPQQVELYVGDIAGVGSGPVAFNDGSPASGLSWVFNSLGSNSDHLEFSTDGVNWNYTPVPDGDGFDGAVRHIRLKPGGRMNGRSGGADPWAEFSFRVRVK